MGTLCERFGISRKTGYKWMQRFLDGGLPNLVDRSRAPHTAPHAVAAELVERIVEMRKRYPYFGPKKLRTRLMALAPDVAWPATSTIGDILRRNGLVEQRRRRPRTPLATQPLASCTAPNIVWSADFKGQFRVADRYCYPLTISDNFSRYLLRCDGMEEPRFEKVQNTFVSAFREHGMPLRIRTDNGSPFASSAPGGLSRLSVWWVKLGITPERIAPGSPQQNGRHERMHRTLKLQTTKPAKSSAAAQQVAFDRFRKHYNDERPHEALGQVTPSSVYQQSTRKYPDETPDPEYPSGFEIRRASKEGVLSVQCASVVLSKVLAHEAVGLEPVDDGKWQLWFGPIYLGSMTEEAKGRVHFIKNKGDGKREKILRKSS